MNLMQMSSSGKGPNPCMHTDAAELRTLFACSRWICDCSNRSSSSFAFLAASFLAFAAFFYWPWALFLDGIASTNRAAAVRITRKECLASLAFLLLSLLLSLPAACCLLLKKSHHHRPQTPIYQTNNEQHKIQINRARQRLLATA